MARRPSGLDAGYLDIEFTETQFNIVRAILGTAKVLGFGVVFSRPPHAATVPALLAKGGVPMDAVAGTLVPAR